MNALAERGQRFRGQRQRLGIEVEAKQFARAALQKRAAMPARANRAVDHALGGEERFHDGFQ